MNKSNFNRISVDIVIFMFDFQKRAQIYFYLKFAHLEFLVLKPEDLLKKIIF